MKSNLNFKNPLGLSSSVDLNRLKYKVAKLHIYDGVGDLVPFIQFKNVKNTHGGVLLLVKLQAKSNTPSWVFFTFFKLYKWYQIAHRIMKVYNRLLQFKS